MKVNVRELVPEETRRFLEVHHAAVRGTAAGDYSSAVIEAWAPLPITDEEVNRVRANAAGEIRVAAVRLGQIIGIGVVIPANCELRACYVLPEAGRSGVGRAIVAKLEWIARAAGTPYLEFDSSLTAVPFYLRLKYKVVKRGEHILSSGTPMTCVKMRKDF
jgi:putative acetyltransferase